MTSRVSRWLFALLGLLGPLGAAGVASPLLELRVDHAGYSPLSLIVRKFGWMEAAFARDGVRVRWVQSEDGRQALRRLGDDQIDIGSADGVAALLARAGGEPLKAVYVYGRPAVAAHEPRLSRVALSRGDRSLDRTEAVGTYGLLNVREAFLADHPQAVERALKVYDRARKWLLTHPEQAARLVAEEAGIALDAARHQLGQIEFFASAPGPAQVAALKAAVPWLVGEGLAKSDTDLIRAAEDLITRAPARAALSVAPGTGRNCGNFCDHW